MKDYRIIGTTANLLSDHGENPEYDRAIVELTTELLGLSHDFGPEVRELLRTEKPIKL